MDDGRLQAWLDSPRSGLSRAERDEIAAHVADCDTCAKRLDELRAADDVSRDLLSSIGAAEAAAPDFSEIVARSRSRAPAGASQGSASGDPVRRPAKRRLPIGWAASIVLAVGVGWMANEVARTEPRVMMPPASTPSAEVPQADPADASRSSVADIGVEPEDAAPVGALAPPSEATALRTETVRSDTDTSAAGGIERPAAPVVAERRALQAPSPAIVAEATPEARPTELQRARSLSDSLRTVSAGADSMRANSIRVDSIRVDSIRVDSTRPATGIPVVRRAFDASGARADSIALRSLDVGATVARETSNEAASPAATISVDGMRLDAGAVWADATLDEADVALGTPPLGLPGLASMGIGRLTIGDASVVRITYEVPDGGAVTLYQSRARLAADTVDGVGQAGRTTEAGVRLLAVGGLDPDRLADLVARAEPLMRPVAPGEADPTGR